MGFYFWLFSTLKGNEPQISAHGDDARLGGVFWDGDRCTLFFPREVRGFGFFMSATNEQGRESEKSQ